MKKGRVKIRHLSVVDQVYEAIKKDILDHVWNVGDKIPSEGELADLFGVNRLSVRMALQKLNTLGLIETRVGEGSFVAQFSMKPYFKEISPLYYSKERLKDVQQLRNLLEGECMNIAIQFATEEQKAQLKKKLDEYNELEAQYQADIDNMDNLETLVNADFAFHYEIIRMSGNHMYMEVYALVEKVIADHIRHLIYTRSHREGGFGIQKEYSHQVIYNSIVNGDAEQAKKAREMMLGVLPEHGTDYYEVFASDSPHTAGDGPV